MLPKLVSLRGCLGTGRPAQAIKFSVKKRELVSPGQAESVSMAPEFGVSGLAQKKGVLLAEIAQRHECHSNPNIVCEISAGFRQSSPCVGAEATQIHHACNSFAAVVVPIVGRIAWTRNDVGISA